MHLKKKSQIPPIIISNQQLDITFLTKSLINRVGENRFLYKTIKKNVKVKYAPDGYRQIINTLPKWPKIGIIS